MTGTGLTYETDLFQMTRPRHEWLALMASVNSAVGHLELSLNTPYSATVCAQLSRFQESLKVMLDCGSWK